MAHFEFKSITSRMEVEGGDLTLVIEGRVVNTSKERRLAPSIRYRKIGWFGRRTPKQLVHEGAGYMGPGQNHGFVFRLSHYQDLGEEFDIALEER